MENVTFSIEPTASYIVLIFHFDDLVTLSNALGDILDAVLLRRFFPVSFYDLFIVFLLTLNDLFFGVSSIQKRTL